MTGRGIDQVLPHPCRPELREPAVTSATRYIALAEELNGPIAKPVDFSYIWGDALDVFKRSRIDTRIINLETSITTSADFWPKGIHYRMHPANVPCIAAAGIDCCVLANNHIADFGLKGLLDTLATLEHAGIAVAGAGRDSAAASAPAIKGLIGKGRVLVFGFGLSTSGIPRDWKAGPRTPGVNLLADLSQRTVNRIAAEVRAVKQGDDLVVASIHWGGNWGYYIPAEQTAFAHKLIDAGVDLLHGHSSHHPKAIEIYRGKLILYGCGDFLDDYEGITGYEDFRDDLALMYLPTIETGDGRLTRLELVPFQIKNFRLNRASNEDARWLCDILNREGKEFGTAFELASEALGKNIIQSRIAG